MLRSLPILLLLAFLPFQSTTPPAAPAAADTKCTTCDGHGHAVLDCAHCEGDGKGPCPDCDPPTMSDGTKRQIDALAATDPKKAKELEKAAAELEESMARLGKLMGRSMLENTPGELGCPNAGCREGVSYLNRGFDCLVCKKKGSLKCDRCRGKGETKCVVCTGKKKRDVPCPECYGAKTAPDPLKRTTDAASCPWCNGAEFRTCHACDDQGKVDIVCPTCSGEKVVMCRKCAGTTRAGCNKCSGTGDLSSYLAAKKSNRCDKCGAKGVLDCAECKKGRVTCKSCDGLGRGEFPCTICLGGRTAKCVGCADGAHRAWSVTADRLFAAEKYAEAKAHIDVAMKRSEARNERLLREFKGSDKERKAFKRELDRAHKALRGRAVKIAKKARD